MIISKTPYRLPISGGGTDLDFFYKKKNGLFSSVAINQYVYVFLNERNIQKNFFVQTTNVEFKKKGSELKGILYAKKLRLEQECAISTQKMVVLKQELSVRKDGSDEGHVDNIEEMISKPITPDSVGNMSEEQKKSIAMYQHCFHKCKSLTEDLKVVDTLEKYQET